MSTRNRRLDLVLFGATGFTGRQAVRALLRQRPGARWAVAGRDADRLRQAVDAQRVPDMAEPRLIVADARDPDTLRTIARQTKVLLNLAGPYHATGDAVVAACIEAGTHYLDLTGETFWIRRLVERQHDAAVRAGVKIIPCAGYEALPFDLATLWAAHQLRAHGGGPCREVQLRVSFTGRRPLALRDAVSGGTAATITELLAHDRSDCLRDMGCLLPPGTPQAAAIARRNALHWLPELDADGRTVLAPTLPGPFIVPPVVLRGVALIDDPTLFAPDFRYREGTDLRRLAPAIDLLPRPAALALQWAAAASIALPLANLAATVGGPLQFQREALRRLLLQLVPKPGQGPREAALAGMGWAFDVSARGRHGARFHGRVEASGHPGYRSTPEMVVCAALGLADGTLGRTPHVGIVSPAAGLGIETVAALAAAGVRFSPAASGAAFATAAPSAPAPRAAARPSPRPRSRARRRAPTA
jgi:short subunit dehydrogenase-like uncharacterized protein